MPTCPHCQHESAAGNIACPHCGKILGPAKRPPPPPPPLPAPARKAAGSSPDDTLAIGDSSVMAIGDSSVIELAGAPGGPPPTPPAFPPSAVVPAGVVPAAAAPPGVAEPAVAPPGAPLAGDASSGVAAPVLAPAEELGPEPRPAPVSAAESVGKLLVTAVPYVFELVNTRRGLRARRTQLSGQEGQAERELEGALAALGADARKAEVRDATLEPVLASLAADEGRRRAAIDAAAELKVKHEAADRLAAVDEAKLQAEWQEADGRAGEAEAVFEETSGERRGLGAAIDRLRELRARLEAEATEREGVSAARPSRAEATEREGVSAARPSRAEARALAAGLRRQAAALAAAEPGLGEEAAALDERVAELRARAEAMRSEATARRGRLDAASAARRQAAATFSAAAAEHAREQVEAERQIERGTTELGRHLARARQLVPALQEAYQRLDRVEESNDSRRKALEKIEVDLLACDKRKLYTGVGILGLAALVLVIVLILAVA